MKKINFLILLSMTLFCLPLSARQTVQQATDSLNNILTKARAGDAAAQNEVGLWYYVGRHTDRNYEEALQWWAKSAQQGNVEAIGNMGLCYQFGNGIAPDSLKAAQLYQRSIQEGNENLFKQQEDLASKGNVFSNMLVASCYQKGIGVKKDAMKAVPYLETAANKGCLLAQRDLGMIYINKKQPEDAFKWFEKGAASQNETCMFYYAKMLTEGMGTAKNVARGVECMKKTAEMGFPQAMYYMGNCYMDGTGVVKNPEEAVEWYRRAAVKGAFNAQWELAQCYREGKGTDISYAQAIRWYSAALKKGYKTAFLKLINDSIPDSPFIAYAQGVKKMLAQNETGALNDFKKVEKAGVPVGKIMVAGIMASDTKSKGDEKKGLKILREMAGTYPEASYILAQILLKKVKNENELPEVVTYLKKAAEKGVPAAQADLGDMYYKGEGVEKNLVEAVKWFDKAHTYGALNRDERKILATCYEEGTGGVMADPAKAKEILNTSDDMFDVKALLELF